MFFFLNTRITTIFLNNFFNMLCSLWWHRRLACHEVCDDVDYFIFIKRRLFSLILHIFLTFEIGFKNFLITIRTRTIIIKFIGNLTQKQAIFCISFILANRFQFLKSFFIFSKTVEHISVFIFKLIFWCAWFAENINSLLKLFEFHARHD